MSEVQNDDLSDLVGRADYSGGGAKFDVVSPKEGSPVMGRVIPPIKSGKKTGEWAKFWRLHWGWVGWNKDKTKERRRPVLCIQEKDFNTGMVTQECPLCDLLAAKNTERDDLETTLRQKKKDPRKDEELTALNGWLYDHGVDGKWYLHLYTMDNKLTMCKINHTAMKSMRVTNQKIVAKNLQPVGITAPFFEFVRPNKNGKEDRVDVVRGDDEKFVMHTLTRDILEQAIRILPDLSAEMERNRYTFEQMAALAECSGSPDEVDAILGVQTDTTAGGDEEPQEAAPPKPAQKPAAAQKPSKPAPAPAPEPEEPAEAEADEVDEDEAALAALQAKLAAKKAASASKTVTSAKPKPAPVAPADNADEPAETEEERVAREAAEDEDWESIFKKKNQGK